MGSSNNNNNNANGFEFYSNGCSHASVPTHTSVTTSSALNKQSTNLHSNGIDENTLHNQQHKELVQSRAKCKQAPPPSRTNGVYHSNGIGATTHLTPTPSNHQLAHVINSLSSPESAYSTGYSTDGTSPSGKKKIKNCAFTQSNLHHHDWCVHSHQVKKIIKKRMS